MSLQCQTRGALFITRRCLVYDGWMDAGCPGSVSSFNFGNVSPSLVTRAARPRHWNCSGQGYHFFVPLLEDHCLQGDTGHPHHDTQHLVQGALSSLDKISCIPHYEIPSSYICRYLPNIIWFILSLRLKTQSRTDCNTHTHNSPCKGCTCSVTKMCHWRNRHLQITFVTTCV